VIIDYYDLETNGLLQPKRERNGEMHPAMDTIHSVLIIRVDTATGTLRKISGAHAYEKGQTGRGWERMSVVDALHVLAEADVRIGHNIQDFDERAILLVYPWWKPKPGSTIEDTLVLSRLIYPDIAKSGPNSHKLKGNMRTRHSLECWGIRLGEHKASYRGGWLVWNEDMQDYGEQDVVVLLKLWKWLKAQKPDPVSVELEHAFAAVIRRQESRGFAFDHPKALTLLASLQSRETELEEALIEAFGEWWAHGKAAHAGASRVEREEEDEEGDDPEEQERRRVLWLEQQKWGDVVVTTKPRNASLAHLPDVALRRFSETTGKELKPYEGPPKALYEQGGAYTPIKRIQFRPGSRAHVRQRLIVKYGWEPSRFTKGGKNSPPQPIVDDDVLSALPYPEAKLLAEYYLVLKRIGMLATGQKAWLKVARETEHPNGDKTYRIHGKVNTNGAVTGRCTHSDPNLAQVPKNTAGTKQYPHAPMLHGAACRDLFIAGEGYELVGFDGSSLELRMLAHYVSRWDKGAYAEVVANGVKEEGTDPHSWLRDLVGTNLLGAGNLGRDNAKTTMYAFVYGAGNEKLGSIVTPLGTLSEKRAIGEEVRHKVLGAFSAMAHLQTALTQTVETKGFLTGLDGRKLRVRKAHAALNTLLQSAGAIVMKKSLVLLDANLRAQGLTPGTDYEFVANVHDEAQAEVLPSRVELYSKLALDCVPQAGKALGLHCPLQAEVSPSPDHRPARSWMETH
jgi:hypothetical protein